MKNKKPSAKKNTVLAATFRCAVGSRQFFQVYKEQFAGAGPPGGAGENGYGVEIYKLEGNRRLAVVQCALAAYQVAEKEQKK